MKRAIAQTLAIHMCNAFCRVVSSQLSFWYGLFKCNADGENDVSLQRLPRRQNEIVLMPYHGKQKLKNL